MDSAMLETILVALVTRGMYLGRSFSAGRHTPAVRTEDAPEWCVLNLQGSPVVLTHSAYDAALACAYCESGKHEPDPADDPQEWPRDADVVRWAKLDRLDDLHARGYLQ